ncbi:MAG: aminotransferase class V-fold PLP-dependent enzyme [Deltaproteobacteria bacterium]|nr:aminotransferase class V-fold PLP-dependent enzyme [Deltaproteobacteria bacterium]
MAVKLQKDFLLAPGPTPVPPIVAQAAARPIIHHRTPKFSQLVKECTDGLRYLFCTQHDIYTLSASGTGAMEAAVANLCSPGETAIVVEGGKFGERWTKICQAYQVKPIVLKIPYGDTIAPEAIGKSLKEHPEAKAVFTQLSETSTGCVYDIKAIGELVSATPALLVVDGISGLGAERCPVDAWQIDVMVTGSQKGLMLPPGLAAISCSPKAVAAMEKSTSPRFYFDLRAYRKMLPEGQHPYTPAIGLFVQLSEAVRLIREETVEGIWARHQWLGNACRAAIAALGLQLFAKRPGNVLTAVKTPDGIDGGKLVKSMRDQFGVTIAGGQGEEMKGKLFRIAHLGYMDRFDVIRGCGRCRGPVDQDAHMNVLICDGLDPEAVRLIESGGHTVTVRKGIPSDELAQLFKTHEICVVRSATKVTRPLLERAERLKLVIRAGVGLDNIDAEACEARGIRVLNTPLATSISVAEHTFALMLSLARHIPQSHASVHGGEWKRKFFEGSELFGKTLGVIGFGRIGQEVAKRAQAFRMHVLAHDHVIDMEVVAVLEIESVGLDALLAAADYITLHLPLLPSTQNILNRERIRSMKRGARIINTARGGLIDEPALAEAIREGHIAGAALDVYATEPPGTDNPLMQLPQVITVPHLGGSTAEGQHRAGLEVARLIMEFKGA